MSIELEGYKTILKHLDDACTTRDPEGVHRWAKEERKHIYEHFMYERGDKAHIDEPEARILREEVTAKHSNIFSKIIANLKDENGVQRTGPGIIEAIFAQLDQEQATGDNNNEH